ncbi:GEM protein [Salix suchowensis]|nr:GEM protein [Salix suchowensis]
MNMKGQVAEKFYGSPLMIIKSVETTPERPSLSEPVSLLQSPYSSQGSPTSSKTSSNKWDSNPGKTKKLGRKSSTFAYRFRDHVKLGPNFSETVKGKLRLGAKIIQGGGRENIFKQVFGVGEEEELLKASQCYLSTTSGPIAGLLFISTEKVAFCSERSITFASPNGQFVRKPYKVVIPVRKIERANRSENMEKPQQKYIEIVTQDNFEFWFMGFLRYEKAFKNLHKAISLASSSS